MSQLLLTPDTVIARVAATSAETEQALNVAATTIRVRNLGPNTVYLDVKTGVTTANGYPMIANAAEDFETEQGTESLFFICAAAETAAVHIIEQVIDR